MSEIVANVEYKSLNLVDSDFESLHLMAQCESR